MFVELSRLFTKATGDPAGARKPESKEKEKPPPVKEQGDTKKGEKPSEPKPKATGEGAPAPAPTATAPAIPGATTDGSLSEWAYHQFGVVGLASRVWQGPELPEPKPAAAGAPAGAIPADGEARWLYWNDHVMGGRAFVPFAPFDHVTLGKIELGGWKPGVRLNPPFEQVGPLGGATSPSSSSSRSGYPAWRSATSRSRPRGEGSSRSPRRWPTTASSPRPWPRASAPARPTRSASGSIPAPRGSWPARPAPQIDSLGGSGGHKEFRWLILAPVPGKDAATPPTIALQASSPKAGQVRSAIALRKRE